ncbi:MAG: dTDP-4-dehydrorhamnose reductase [Nitrospirota bacterium]
MKIVIIGANGQIGNDLVETLTSDEIISLTHNDIDISDFSQTGDILKKYRPDMVINTAAYHRVDHCEDAIERTFEVNSYAVRNLAQICADMEIPLVHFSTDYVFGGEKESPYIEEDTPNPLSVYAVSKLTGEYFIRSICSKYYLIRTCGLYGVTGAAENAVTVNFVEIMVGLAKKKRPIRVVSDQIVTPTSAKELAIKVSQLIRTERYGLYHITNNGECSWYEFTKAIFDLCGIKSELYPVRTSEYGAKAKRPLYSVLKNRNLKRLGLDDLRHWRDAMKEYLRVRGYVCGKP